MFIRAHTYVIQAMSVQPVTVEVDVRPGLPAFTVVGLADGAVRETRDRVRAAILNSGYEFPNRRITVSIAPGDVPPFRPELDVALACALLAASGQVPSRLLESHVLFGELGLDGHVRSRPGALAVAEAASLAGWRALVLGPGQAREAAIVSELQIISASHLKSAVRILNGGSGDPLPSPAAFSGQPPLHPDLSDIRGQQHGVQALTLAAAGGHHLLLIGPRGSGRSMLAQRLPGILPPLSEEEVVEVTRTYSLAGRLADCAGLVTARPFRAPHHTIGLAGLAGGGTGRFPGEMILADHGVLYLDELTEFSSATLWAINQPLRSRCVKIARGQRSTTHPARFILLGGTDPCPCGHLGDSELCHCDKADLRRYQQRLRRPLLGHFSLFADLQRPDPKGLSQPPAQSSQETRERVILARERQHERLRGEGITLNAEMSPAVLYRHGALSRDCRQLASEAQLERAFSASAGHRLLCIARTAADLDASEKVHEQHLQLALNFSFSSLNPPHDA